MAETALKEAASSLPVADLRASEIPADSDAKPTAGTADDSPQLTDDTAPSSNPSGQVVKLQSPADNQHASRAGTPQRQEHQPKLTSTRSPSIETAKQKSDTASDGSHTGRSSPAVNASDNIMTDMTSYGTRSRNRTGNARINYAEDQEMDFEFTSAATTTAAATTTTTTATSSTSKKRATAVDATPATAAVATKESTPAINGGSAAGTTKKRKAAANNASTPPISNVHTSAVAARKVGAAVSMAATRETNLMTFSKHKSTLNKRGELIADDGTKLSVNDHVYLVCEPPGDPYYLCRIMEFLHVRSDDPSSPVDALRVNWYYRPRDVQRFNSDSRLVYGTMHSDICPLTSLRGQCVIRHRSEIDDLDAYRKEPNSFYFVQVFDRFIRRWYECIPVAQIINVPEKVKKALDERWKFVVVETGRVKELTSAVKTCKRCARYCASQDSIDCAICKNSYHMNCVQPPLPKKPSRGFAWACGPCSRASEREIEARNTPNVSGNVTEAEEEAVEEEEAPAPSSDVTRGPSPDPDMAVDDHPATQAEIALAQMWPMRYLGIHCRVEDALQYDDRAIYPRASSRLGPRHQAAVNVWHGHSVELVKPAEIKKRYHKGPGPKKDSKLTKEAIAAIEAEREERAKRPKWVQDEPPGYIARGEDYPADDPRCTARLIFKMPEDDATENIHGESSKSAKDRQVSLDSYVKRARQFARGIGVAPFGTNFMDKVLELLTDNNFDVDDALKQIPKVDRKADLHEPVLSKADLTKFEEGVAKYGSEHRLIRLHMKTTLPNSDIVRFYYLWKKTYKGKEIWGNYGGRKGKHKVETDAGAKLQAEVSHDVDDSAFDYEKASKRGRGFQCKFCFTTHARQWRKAPGVSPGQTVLTDSKSGSKDKKERLLLALCLRCAGLWRKYAIQWEDVDDVSKKVNTAAGKAWKKRIDEELFREIVAANEAANMLPEPPSVPTVENGEPPKKRSKLDKETIAEPAKRKEKPLPPPKEPTPPPPPIIPQQPTWRELPCAVCRSSGGDPIACAHCRLTVHRRCYGLSENEGVKQDGSVKWICEQCQNDRNPQISTEYACCLCLTEETPVDLIEAPRSSHKKKTDRDREKERMEKELADNMRVEYRNKQLTHHRPVIPREPLKRTTGNNWVHVYCAIWSPEVKFSKAKAFEIAEGFQLIPQTRFEAVCKLCKNKDHQNRVRHNAGACVSCFQCQANFHASCAFEAGYTFGFDVTPVKSSRKDQIVTAKLGQDAGALTAVILCKEHLSKNTVHPISEIANEDGQTALQVYVEHYKQADLTLTGTVRKANIAQLTKDKSQVLVVGHGSASRRESTINNMASSIRRGARTASVAEIKMEGDDAGADISADAEVHSDRQCVCCRIDVTPRWHLIGREEPIIPKEPTPPRSPNHADLRRLNNNPADKHGTHQRQRSNTIDITGAPMSASKRSQDLSRQAILIDDANDSDDSFGSYLCHKCYLRRDKEPSPPPPPPPRNRHEFASRSPPRSGGTPHDWRRNNIPPAPPVFEHPSRLGWEENHRSLGHPPAQVPPPSASAAPMPAVNGLGLASYGPQPSQPPPPTSSSYGHPPSYPSQPNGYHGPPSHHGHAQMHDRGPPPGGPPPPPPSSAFGPPTNGVPFSYGPPTHRVPPPSGYPPPPPPGLTNGLASPHNQHPALSPPPYHQPYASYQPSHRDPTITSPHMPGMRPLPHDRPYGHPDNGSGGGMVPPPPVHGSPRIPQARAESIPNPPNQHIRPTTPRDGVRNVTPGASSTAAMTTVPTTGASASPSLRNLLH